MFTIKCKFRSNPTRDPWNYQHNCNSYCEAPRLQAQHAQLQQYSMARVYSAPVWIWFSVSYLRHSIGSLKLKQSIACNKCRTKNVTIHVHNWTCFFELSWMQKVNVYSIVSFKKDKKNLHCLRLPTSKNIAKTGDWFYYEVTVISTEKMLQIHDRCFKSQRTPCHKYTLGGPEPMWHSLAGCGCCTTGARNTRRLMPWLNTWCLIPITGLCLYIAEPKHKWMESYLTE
jgi:hypothetical protein